MQKEMIIVAVAGLVLLIIIVQSLQITSMNTGLASAKTVNSPAASNGAIDTTGWTANEKMNYEMHGTIPARAKGSVSSGSVPTQVGGC